MVNAVAAAEAGVGVGIEMVAGDADLGVGVEAEAATAIVIVTWWTTVEMTGIEGLLVLEAVGSNAKITLTMADTEEAGTFEK
jgi:hypothetical protein